MENSAPTHFRNPVLPGFHPDPTVCRVGEDYYLAVSSFTYFPGVPLFHSRDLVNWRPVGHALTRPAQFPVRPQAHSEGIYAPTLRHDGRRFWLITTNVGSGAGGNFIVTADRIEGPWSDPVYLDDAPGIDPSLLFDDDGRVWVTGTAEVPEGGRYFGDNEIWLRELDPLTLKWKGPRTGLWRGALKEVVWPEGPHLYKREGWYYLVISEAGTGVHHAVTVARSRSVEGPYEGHRANPILTHRHLGAGYPITCTGHPDLVEVPGDGWWMVLLACRPHHGGGTNRGRETFLVPVAWEDGWPVVSPGTGRLETRYRRPALAWAPWADHDPAGFFDGFDAPVLGPRWSFLRSSDSPVHSLTARPGWLRLVGRAEGPGTRNPQAWVGVRVAHEVWTLRTSVDFGPGNPGSRAGLCVFQSDDFHLRIEADWGGVVEEAAAEVRVVARIGGADEVLYRADGRPRGLQVVCEGHRITLGWLTTAGVWSQAGEAVDGSFLTTDRAGGFVGCLAGPFAAAGTADFDWVDYRGRD